MSALDLPIYEAADELVRLFASEPAIIVAGETGSGKSTQLPQMVRRSGREGLIGHTQPRRIAARTVAERIAEEMGTTIGDRVGYAVRFTDRVSPKTEIKLMTDGILLAEIQRDPLLRKYSTLIIDEAHERSLNVDFLLGYLKDVLTRRDDLLLIVTSATIDTERFSDHFDGAPIVEVTGRTYPVEVRYREPETGDRANEGLTRAVEELVREGPGDILAFFPGERDIRDAADAIKGLRLANTEVLPLYARLSAADQHRVFARHSGRRIILATNVAETSLTVPGIRYVIDTGTARISRYSQRTKVQRLPIEAISQASANQRSGRCGRLGPGIAVRLYAEDDFDQRPEFTEPEILRTSLASVILQMAALGVYDIESFDFVDPPQTRNINDGIRLLAEIDAVDPEREGTRRWLTPIGRQLARLPLDPRLARIILAADDEDCLTEILIIAAAMSIIDPRERPTGSEAAARESHRRFNDANSDFLSYLNLWKYLAEERKARSGNQFRKMCRSEYLNYMRVREWQDVHRQLQRVTKQLKLRPNRTKADSASVHRAILAGYLSNVGLKSTKDETYRGARNASFVIAPGSTLHKAGPKWVLAGELTETNRLYGRTCARIQPEWIEQVGGDSLAYSYGDPWWDAERGAAVTTEKVSIFGLPIVADRRINYHRVAPRHARSLFIYHALVLGDWESPHVFLRRNAETLADAKALEARTRSADLALGPDELEEWYSERLPDSVVSGREFDKWWRHNRENNPELLIMSPADVMRAEPDDEAHHRFPETLSAGRWELALTYELADDHTDGVTIEVPVEALAELDQRLFDWLVPGFRAELFELMIRYLPKEQRKEFIPVPQTAAELVDAIEASDVSVESALAEALVSRSGLAISAGSFDGLERPAHLRFFVEVVDEDSHLIATGSDLGELKRLISTEVRNSVAGSGHELEKTGRRAWEFGNLPRSVTTEALGHTVEVYPAVCDEGETVGVSLCADPAEQATIMWAGTRRLLRLTVPSQVRDVLRALSNQDRLVIGASPVASEGIFLDDCVAAAFDRSMERHGAPAWGSHSFAVLQEEIRPEVPDELAKAVEAGLSALEALAELRADIRRRSGVVYDPAVADIEGQVARLVYPGFVSGLGAINLANVPRYLQGAVIRLERLAKHPTRDGSNMAAVRALEAAYDLLVDEHGVTAELDRFGWQLEELRVELFANRLGTATPVSIKRLRKVLDRLAD